MPKAGTPTKREERAQAQRERILRAAEQCFIEHGFHAASMASIAESAEMSPGLIYRYFDSKSDIILAIIERQLAERRANIATLQDECELATRIMKLFSSWQRGDPEVNSAPLFLEMSAEASRDKQIAKALREADELTRSDLSHWLEKRNGQEQDSSHWRSFAIQCFIEGLVIRAIREPELDSAVVERTLRVFLPAILKES